MPLDTNVTPNQGGTYSSASISRGGPTIRQASAEARQALLKMASDRLGVEPHFLGVQSGVVYVLADPDKSVTYGQLIGGRRFDMVFTGNAPVKPVGQYRVVGKPLPRKDMPAKVKGEYTYMQHLRTDGMLHGRVVRPRGQAAYGVGAKITSLDENSISGIPGARVIRRGDFLGVVAPTEWDAVRAARDLKVTWDRPPVLPEYKNLYKQMRAEVTEDREVINEGDVDAAFASSKAVVEFAANSPYQMHGLMAPNCALADVRADAATIACSTQDAYGTRRTLAGILGLDQEKIRVQYIEGSGTYGHSCYDDVAQAAAILSQEAGAPVRLQFMRWDEHGWDLYGPAHVGEVKIGADAEGNITGYQYNGWQNNWSLVETSQQLTGTAPAEWPGAAAQQVSAAHLGAMYKTPSIKLINHKTPAEKYLRGAWLRSPLDVAMAFTSEQAIDELARRLGMDAYQFRRQNISNDRWLGVLDAVAQAANWEPRAPASEVDSSEVVTGRGIALATHLQSWGAAVAEVEVNRRTGKVRAKKLYGAIDAGLTVNPGNVESQITGQLVQAASRMLIEEVKFTPEGVTSLDWNSYPVIRFEDVPEVVPIVVQRLNEPSSGAGEECLAAAAAAIANAFFDATGVHMTEHPLTPERVLVALG